MPFSPLLLLTACAHMQVQIDAPQGDTLIVDNKERIEIPGRRTFSPGKHVARLEISDTHARRLGVASSTVLYGYLTVGQPTENASLTNLSLSVSDDLIKEVVRTGQVMETMLYDDGAGGQVLVSLKLGSRAP